MRTIIHLVVLIAGFLGGIYVGVHFPLDVLGGIVIGVATALLLLAAARRQSTRLRRRG